MTSIVFTVPGDVVPWARPRIGKRGLFTEPRVRKYKKLVSEHARAAWQSTKRAGVSWPLDAEYEVDCVFVRSTLQRFDIDRAINSILDALVGVLFEDDRSRFVRVLHGRIADVDKKDPRTHVCVSVLEPIVVPSPQFSLLGGA